MNTLPINSFFEIALPAVDLRKSTEFYMLLGYKIIEEQDWGMVSLQRNDSRIVLLSQSFFKSPSIGYLTENLEHVKNEMRTQNLEIIEDDSQSIPARITMKDPAGNEITIYQK